MIPGRRHRPLAAAAMCLFAASLSLSARAEPPTAGASCAATVAGRAHPCLCRTLVTTKAGGGESLGFLGEAPFFSASRGIGGARVTEAGRVIAVVLGTPRRPRPDENDEYAGCEVSVVDPVTRTVEWKGEVDRCGTPDLASDGRRLVYVDRHGVKIVDLGAGKRPAPRLVMRNRSRGRHADEPEPVGARWLDDKTLVVRMSGEAGYVWAWRVSTSGKVLDRGPSTVTLHRPVRGAYALANYDDHEPGHLTVVGADGREQSFTSHLAPKRPAQKNDDPLGDLLAPAGAFHDAVLAPDLARVLFELSGRYYVRRLGTKDREAPRLVELGIDAGRIEDVAWLDANRVALLLEKTESGAPAEIVVADLTPGKEMPFVEGAPFRKLDTRLALPAESKATWLPDVCARP